MQEGQTSSLHEWQNADRVDFWWRTHFRVRDRFFLDAFGRGWISEGFDSDGADSDGTLDLRDFWDFLVLVVFAVLLGDAGSFFEADFSLLEWLVLLGDAGSFFEADFSLLERLVLLGEAGSFFEADFSILE